MLFNSYVFIFLFLPPAFLVFFRLGAINPTLAASWLALASLVFYGWWNPVYVPLLLVSIVCNYTLGLLIVKAVQPARRRWLILAVCFNLLLLAYFKYANFFLDSLNALINTPIRWGEITLPLGISFFTFTQLAFLVDTYRGEVREYNPIHYALFVTYFPHLIAGPVLHHKEMMPQFARAGTYRINLQNTAIGLSIFAIGLFKKVMVADHLALYANLVFSAAESQATLSFVESWGGVLAYSLQLYFDFSGYSDMAIGLSYLFNIHLPINFYSPYKACNIIEFWRRWHMTLSRFLRDYLYFPLGGNRKGPLRRYVNLMLTMLLGGFWHGAGWNFILWGALHGTYLIVNHGWQVLRRSLGYDPRSSTVVGRLSATLLTFLAVVVAWVFFRAKTLSGAQLILKGMIGLNGIVLPAGWLGGLTVRLADFGVHAGDLPLFAGALQLLWIVLALLACWLLPNTAQFMVLTAPPHGSEALPSPGGGTALRWRPTWVFACYCAVLATCGLLGLNRVTEFLYFNF